MNRLPLFKSSRQSAVNGVRCALLLLCVLLLAPAARAQAAAPYTARRLARGVYAVLGDTGRGVEGRANAGFVVTDSGVVVVDALGSPEQGARLLRTVRGVTAAPVRWLVLTHHHPDHHFGAIAFRRAGARVVAHPERGTLSTAPGDEEPVAAWTRVVGAREMRGFAWADTPDVPVARDTVLRIGGRTISLWSPGPAHTPGDLAVWLPDERVLFAGDLLVEDGVTMLVDGNSSVLLAALAHIDSLDPRVVVPGHGRIPADPRALVALTRRYADSLRSATRAAVARGVPMSRLLAGMPRVDAARPVSRPSREQRNAVRVYLEMEREAMGFGGGSRLSADQPGAEGRGPLSIALMSPDSLAPLIGAVTLLDVRADVAQYLRSHVEGAQYLNTESLRGSEGGVPNLLLPRASYAALFARLGVRADRPVVVYASGEARGIDATYVAWILSALGHPAVRVLDGGFARWELEGRPTTRKYPAVTTSGWTPAAFAPERATLDDVRRAMRRPGAVIVDARVREQYVGEAGAQMRRGHIPGAINHYWQDDLVEGGVARVWRPRDEIRARYAAQGITPDKDIIAYCNGGLESSHVWFTLRVVLGYPRVRVYDGSWTEWAEREELPIETGG